MLIQRLSMERGGGVVYATNSFFMAAKCEFTNCSSSGNGQVLLIKSKEIDITNCDFISCHYEFRNADSVAYTISETSVFRSKSSS